LVGRGVKTENSLVVVFAGGLVAFILTPIEMVKSRLQIQTTAGALYRGPLDCIAKSVQTEGMGVMYRGYTATLLREIPGTAAWFTVYELVVRVRVSPVFRCGLHTVCLAVGSPLDS
jgi:hypothetical protein